MLEYSALFTISPGCFHTNAKNDGGDDGGDDAPSSSWAKFVHGLIKILGVDH